MTRQSKIARKVVVWFNSGRFDKLMNLTRKRGTSPVKTLFDLVDEAADRELPLAPIITIRDPNPEETPSPEVEASDPDEGGEES